MTNNEHFFSERLQQIQRERHKQKQLFNRFASLRLLLFVAGISLAVYLYNIDEHYPAAGVLFVFLLAFAVSMKFHQKIKWMLTYLDQLIAINQEEQQRVQHDYSGMPTGSKYYFKEHPYALDLDLFGNNSLFQQINRCATFLGMDQLAQWMLKRPSEKKTVLQRQQAVKELTPMTEWRQDFEATGRALRPDESSVNNLLHWLGQPTELVDEKIVIRLLHILTLITPAIGILVMSGWISGLVLLVFLMSNGILYRKRIKLVRDTKSKVTNQVKPLHAYALLLEKIESTSFQSEELNALQSRVRIDNGTASVEIKRLFKLLNYLDYTDNIYFGLVANGVFNWDLHFMWRIEKWKQRNASLYDEWTEVISDFDALNSMAGMAFLHSERPFPEFTDELHSIEATALGHPLIHAENRVCNDVSLAHSGEVFIITGSNMSGKSTFLRTVGINLVLANMGAPVCAGHLNCAFMDVFTAMRTEDDLSENTSSFYAELKRLQQLIRQIPSKPATFFLLDEILKGTNSADRHRGAKALARQLVRLNTSGMISTHDTALGDLEKKQPDNIKNYSFASTLVNDELVFDYKMYRGVCKSFNASKLMEQIGIELDEEV